MILHQDLWEKFSRYYYTEEKNERNHAVVSRFKILCSFFGDKEFNREGLTDFLSMMEEKDLEFSYLNNFIKTAKAIAKCFKIPGFDDYKYYDVHLTRNFRVLTYEQIKQIAEKKMSYSRNEEEINYRMRCIIYFVGVMGTRGGETLKLQWENFLSDPIPCVWFPEKITKTTERFCPLPQWLYGDILKLPRGDTVFSLKNTQNLTRDIKARGEACGIENLTTRDLRRSSVNNKLRAGVDLDIVGKFHGHASPATTYRYYTVVEILQMSDNLTLCDPMFMQEPTAGDIHKRLRSLIDKRYKPIKHADKILEAIEKLKQDYRPFLPLPA